MMQSTADFTLYFSTLKKFYNQCRIRRSAFINVFGSDSCFQDVCQHQKTKTKKLVTVMYSEILQCLL